MFRSISWRVSGDLLVCCLWRVLWCLSFSCSGQFVWKRLWWSYSCVLFIKWSGGVLIGWWCLFVRQTSGERIPGGRVMTLDPELLKPMKKRKRRDYLSPSEEESEMETMVGPSWYWNKEQCTHKRVCPNVSTHDLAVGVLNQASFLGNSRFSHHISLCSCITLTGVQHLSPTLVGYAHSLSFLRDFHDRLNQAPHFCLQLLEGTWAEIKGLWSHFTEVL